MEYSKLISESIEVYKKNPVILVPYLFLAIISLFNRIFSDAIQIFQQAEVILLAGFLYLIFMIISLFVDCGTIGMLEKALKKNKTDLDVLFETGKKCWISYFGATILMGSIVLLGLIPIFLFIVQPSIATGIFIILGGIYLVAAVFLLNFYKMAVVIDKKRAFDSLKKSYNVVRKNLVDVIVFYFVLLILALVLIGVPMVFMMFFGILMPSLMIVFLVLALVAIFVLAPLLTLFTISFYLKIR